MKKLALLTICGLIALTSCNQEKIFPDYKYQTVYFAYQYPVRTITLGDDVNVNTDLDNQYKCQIYAATGGVYYSKNDVNIDVAVDNSLLGNGMLFGAGGNQILPMPNEYFSLAANKIVIPKGTLSGGVDVQLTDAFFADPKAIKNTYVIPLRMTGVQNADSILSTKNYILYAVKYINKWHGNYLRRGKDVITGSVNQTLVRRQQYVEKDEVIHLPTHSLKQLELPVTVKDNAGNNVNFKILLSFDNADKCTITSLTQGVTASGSGSFVKKGEKKSWGNTDRDALYIQYEATLPNMKVATTDTLVMRDRGVAMETFTPVSK
jgi:hypothetical protein